MDQNTRDEYNKRKGAKLNYEDINDAREKAKGLGKYVQDFKDMLSMSADIMKGKYSADWWTIGTLATAIAYVASPIDAIPDFIPILGLTDDAAVIGFALNQIGDELDSYRRWRGY